MHYVCQDCMTFCFWHKTVACFSFFGKWTHLGNGTFQACVCLQYTRYCPNTSHDSCRNNNPIFFCQRSEHSQEYIIRSQKHWLGGTSGVHPAALLPALGQVSHALSNWVFRTHSKDKDSPQLSLGSQTVSQTLSWSSQNTLCGHSLFCNWASSTSKKSLIL